jgi:hypothetical protein
METHEEIHKEIEDLRNQARENRTAISKNITIKGHLCTVTAAPIGIWAYQGTNIIIEHKALNGRVCAVDFIYDKGRGVAQELQSLTEKISVVGSVARTISNFSSEITDYVQLMSIDGVSDHAPDICTFLHDVENFVQQNDLTKDEISNLKLELWALCNTPFIQHPQAPDYPFPINECDCDPHCRAIALKAESLEILLDAKASGQVGLERSVSPVKVLGGGKFNTPKPCQSEQRRNQYLCYWQNSRLP